MKKPLRFLLVGAIAIVFLFAAFALGAVTQYRQNQQINIEMASGQAMLWFNHLLRFRELESDLTKGCSTEALEKVKITIAEEMRLLSSFYKEHNNTWVNKYIADRDSTLLAQLDTYKSPYGNSWTEPQCAK
jgi:hypothetical protein